MKENWKFKFYTIWVGQAISILSSSVLQMALIWHLTKLTGSAAVLSMASIAGFLPTAILGMFAGTLVDRWNRKLTIIGADLFIAAVSFVLVLYGLFAEVPVWLVMVILFVRSIGTAFHTPAISAITPLLVPEAELMKCSGYTQTLQTMGYIAGTAVAAVLYPIWSLSTLVMLDVVGALVASATVALTAIPALDKPETVETPRVLREMKEGYLALRENKSLFTLLWVGTIFTLIFSPMSALFPLMCMEYFGGGTTASSIAEIAFGVGMIIGGLLLGSWGGFKKRGFTIIGSLFLMGLSILLSGLLPPSGFVVFAVLCVFMGFSAPFYSGPQMALMQEQIEPQFLGRVFGLYGSVMSLAMPFGLTLSGLFGDMVGIHNWFFYSGVGCVALCIVTLFMPTIRNIPEKLEG